MKKTDKKIEHQIRRVLTQVCEQALKEIDGFCWLTHLVNYNDFPRSLLVICVFETQEQLANLLNSTQHDYLVQGIVEQLKASGIQLPDPSKQIKFDSEEACMQQHGGNWNRRFK